MNISVIIPTYDRADFIEKAIDSVLQQSFKPYEIIIVDDGSTDNTQQLLTKYQNIKIFHQPNSGVSSARNLGINNATGDWIAFLDSDDYWYKDKLLIQSNFHKNNPLYHISHTNETWIRDNKIINKPKKYKKRGGHIFKDSLTHTFVGTSTILIKKSLFSEIGYYDTNLLACEDYDLFLRIALNYEFGYIDKELSFKIAGHKNQLSFNIEFLEEYRVDSLLKLPQSIEVKNTISKKLDILYKGAIKHNNQRIINKYKGVISS